MDFATVRSTDVARRESRCPPKQALSMADRRIRNLACAGAAREGEVVGGGGLLWPATNTGPKGP